MSYILQEIAKELTQARELLEELEIILAEPEEGEDLDHIRERIEEAKEDIEDLEEAYRDEKHYGGLHGIEREMRRNGLRWSDFA